MAAVKALQQWCKVQCDGYRDVSVTNMTTSFRDGLAFCAIIHRHRPDLIDFDSLSKENVYENNHLAFRVAEEQLGIPALLDAEDMVALKVPDRLSILTYVSQYCNYFQGRSPIGGLAGVKRPAEEPVDHLSERRRNQPVTAKEYGSPNPPTEPKRGVLVERTDKSGAVNRNCSICNTHVHLVQRHLVDGKLYHRNCFKCSECSNILLSGTYKQGKEPNTFVCKSHHSAQKAPPIQVAPPARTDRTSPTDAGSPPPAKDITLRSLGKDSTPPPKQGFHWLMSKKENTPAPKSAPTPTPTSAPKSTPTSAPKSTPTPASKSTPTPTFTPAPKTTPTSVPKSTPTPTFTPAPKTTPTPTFTPTPAPRYKSTLSSSVSATVKSPTQQEVLTETPKGPSSSVLKNLEARQRFFESSTETTPSEKPAVGATGPAGGPGKGNLLLRGDDRTREKKREKENDGEKEKAKSVISKFVTGEASKTSSSSSTPHSGPSTNVKSHVSSSAAKGPTTRVLLKAPQMDLDLTPNPRSDKTSSWLRPRDKSPPRAATTQASDNKESDTGPADWRSRLKPVSKNTKSQDSKPTSDLKTPNAPPSNMSKTSNIAPRPWESPAKTSSPSSPSSTNSSEQEPGTSPGTEDGPAYLDVGSRSVSDPSPTMRTHQPSKSDYIPREEILKELKDIEVKLNDLEQEGVELEKQLRQCEEENQEDVLMNDLMVDWFTLIRKKQVFIRRESELVYIGRAQDLEEEQGNVEAELRKLMGKPENLRTPHDKKREEELMTQLVEIVNDRNAIVDGLDEDRLREEEEDEQLNKMMQNLDMEKKEKKKRSSISRWFSKKNKRESVDE